MADWGEKVEKKFVSQILKAITWADLSYFSCFIVTDDEDFEPKSFDPIKQSDKWEGEDEDDDDVKV